MARLIAANDDSIASSRGARGANRGIRDESADATRIEARPGRATRVEDARGTNEGEG